MTSKVETTPNTFFRCANILPGPVCRKLTPEAKRVFALLWNRINSSTADSIWSSDDNIIHIARVRREKLQSTLDELTSAGLLQVTVGLTQNKYRVLAACASTTARQSRTCYQKPLGFTYRQTLSAYTIGSGI